MPDFITLSCPSCGGKLEITSDIERFACAHCGMEHLVKRTSSLVSLSPVLDGINKVKEGVGRTASELAIVRLEKEIATLNDRIITLRRKSQMASRRTKLSFIADWGPIGMMYGFISFCMICVGVLFLTRGKVAEGVFSFYVGFGLVAFSLVHYASSKKTFIEKIRRMPDDVDMELNGLIAQMQLKQNELAIHRGDVGLS